MNLRLVGIVVVAGAVLALLGTWFYFERVANPRVVRELRADPEGERAKKVALLTLPSGREVPANYLRKGDVVYFGADGRWWRELAGAGGRVEVLIQGESLAGQGRAIEDDAEKTKRVFAELRPTALPGFGTLVEVQLEGRAGP